MVVLKFLPVRRPARHRCRSAAFRAGYAVVLSLLVYLRVMLTTSRFRHDFLAKGYARRGTYPALVVHGALCAAAQTEGGDSRRLPTRSVD